ncbi:FAD-binding 9 siderophore-interacting domain protein [Xylanimonas cellulosilytica DSM 15894]|uniref:FAD-binding 9 siderophore-interacting domain protein n=1 Tax=Xylanimonas cellulosilytica (strain DSM 15894 / JCM 12276 / CECT 5975 / KCTC 9989 / LMG 20990 / NBRC 107835 / XIL07) TaxID=446471 RepID=D1BUN5_XYLCX|nr:siderophore-interacting protein [Xylanimonas cellulosilytica]ACZ29276.1 FAD-binding 9 siderophore-interacting domain protein [Xylanimonas cellulosilytica DSM 15894]
MAYKDARKATGLYAAEVQRTKQVTPHMVRVTLVGEDLGALPQRGFDHWFRLFLPSAGEQTDFARLPDRFGIGGYLKYLRTPAGTRPVCRSYTVREHRPELRELDIDFVAHGDTGVAGPWAQKAQPGERVVLLDQGVGFEPAPGTDFHLFAGDESALPAIGGILRDLPRDARGLAVIEVPDAADAQDVEAPDGVEVRWLPRTDPQARAGSLALAEVRAFTPADPATLSAYLVGEQALPTEGRRHLVAHGVPKDRITFIGFWRHGRTS